MFPYFPVFEFHSQFPPKYRYQGLQKMFSVETFNAPMTQSAKKLILLIY